ncbi:hypothetical protein H5410_064953 [Solanum commersonii]|uniref:Uncharacterized protein n=1 Tax=Solanum commersonii TaxID=4109 RepID=A0A9J5VY80_SOLCO|nr:hypothetical protein H5410_064953 [Solanum commersonii]
MSKKFIETPRKSPILVEGTSTDEVHAPTFNILTQSPPPPKFVENPANIENQASSGSSQLKDRKEKKSEAKKRVIQANQTGKKRKGKIIETRPIHDSIFASEIKEKKQM